VLINAKPRTDADTVGMVFQQFSPLPWMTVLENVALGLEFHNVPLKERTEQAMEMLKLVGLEREAHKYAKDTQLSGGQLQRVALARSLVVNPTMVLLDEPNSALDVNTSFQMDLLIMEILERVQATIIYVTHNINSAVLFANHVYVMRKDPGRIVKHFPVPLGKHRDRQTKRDPLFIEIVNQIDDYMNSGVLVS
jgi:ABC-type nitrate/sulfonate/bicarbonate transport system ATPase subunit